MTRFTNHQAAINSNFSALRITLLETYLKFSLVLKKVGKLVEISQEDVKPYSDEDFKVAMERCESGKCELEIDKNSPPVFLNLTNTMDQKSKLTMPKFEVHGGSPATAATNCSAIQIRSPFAFSGFYWLKTPCSNKPARV